jgi:hypothetical protein
MKPHITDHPRPETPSRARHYMELARAHLPSRASLTLQSRRAEPAETSRMAQFLRIARGRTA